MKSSIFLLLLLGGALSLSAQTTLPLLKVDGKEYRDLNKNGRLDVYEDDRQPVQQRVYDLLKLMTLEEKAGMMFITGVLINADGTIDKDPNGQGFASRLPDAREQITVRHMSYFNVWQLPGTQATAKGMNAIQQVAEQSRLGIPVTIASDPRHAFSRNIFAMSEGGFSQWPEQLGFAAIGDTALMHRFGDIARQEYVAMGIREALHPMADLATEPRWARVSGTFGEDANLSAVLVAAYIHGFQGDVLGPQSVACMTKHFSGGGPQKEGLDPHFPFQKGQVYPGNNFDYHVIPFEAAIKAGTASMMPYYGIPKGQTSEDVGFSFNKEIITDLLRNKYHYDGVVCTDWGLVTDAHMGPVVWPARAWGVENLTEEQRVEKIINAGVDQFGGEYCPHYVVSLVKSGKISEDRINESIARLLRQKFELGLFDQPFVDVANVGNVVGKPQFVQEGEVAQRRSFTLLKNDKGTLPLTPGKVKIYVKNIDPAVAAKYGTVVMDPKKADFAIIRLQTPWYPVETDIPMAKGFHHGDLDFKGDSLNQILQLEKTVPTIVDLYLDRPAVVPEIAAAARAMFANYGASDAALLDVIFGKAKPEGKLPFELPSSMEAVRNQKEDLPYDSKNPLFPFGFGLRY